MAVIVCAGDEIKSLGEAECGGFTAETLDESRIENLD